MSFNKLPPISGTTACLTCGCGSHDTLRTEALLAVGFGTCCVEKDEATIYDENAEQTHAGLMDDEGWVHLSAIEKLAAADPDHDWRVHFFAPLYESHYQRQGDNHWVLYEKGEGFA